jgi:hypothetical protein
LGVGGGADGIVKKITPSTPHPCNVRQRRSNYHGEYGNVELCRIHGLRAKQ